MSTDPKTERLRPPTDAGASTKRGCTSWLLISCVVLAMTTSFVFGWGIGAPNMYNHYTEPFLKGLDACAVEKEARAKANEAPTAPIISETQDVGERSGTESARAPTEEDKELLAEDSPSKAKSKTKEPFNFVYELVKGIPQTVFLIGAFIGAVTGPSWVKLFDRKRTVFANYIFTFVSSLCVLLSYYFRQTWLFYFSRFFLGYQGGMACAVVPPFIGEIASQKVRGSAGAAFQLGLTLGILIAQLIGLPHVAGTCESWGWGLAIVFLLPLAGLFILFLLPNSPTQMIAKYGNEEQAVIDLKKLRGMENVQADLDAIHEQTRQSSGNKNEVLSIFQVLTRARYRWPMLTTIALQFGQALSGINAVFFYSSKMFAKAGIPPSYIPYANIGTGGINVLATIVAIFLIEKLGRKKLIIYPMSVMVVVFGILTALVQLNESRNSSTLGLISVIFILIFIICFAVGLGPIPYLYGSEVCRPEARDSVQSLGLVANYIGNILLSLFFPALNSVLGGYVFLIFAIVVLLHVIFLLKFMPETRDKSIEQVEQHWNIAPQTGDEKLMPSPVTA